MHPNSKTWWVLERVIVTVVVAAAMLLGLYVFEGLSFGWLPGIGIALCVGVLCALIGGDVIGSVVEAFFAGL